MNWMICENFSYRIVYMYVIFRGDDVHLYHMVQSFSSSANNLASTASFLAFRLNVCLLPVSTRGDSQR